jgi:hypothetical protein
MKCSLLILHICSILGLISKELAFPHKIIDEVIGLNFNLMLKDVAMIDCHICSNILDTKKITSKWNTVAIAI